MAHVPRLHASRRSFFLSGLPLLAGCQKQCGSSQATSPGEQETHSIGEVRTAERSERPRLEFGSTGSKQLGLDITIVSFERVDGADRLAIDVSWENTSPEPLRIYQRSNSWGAHQLAFLLCHEDGRRFLFTNGVRAWDENAPLTEVIRPGKTHEERVYLKLREGAESPDDSATQPSDSAIQPSAETDHWVAVAAGIRPEAALDNPQPMSSSGHYPWYVKALFMSLAPDQDPTPGQVELFIGQASALSFVLDPRMSGFPEPQLRAEPLEHPVTWAFPPTIRRNEPRSLPPFASSLGLLHEAENGLRLSADVVRQGNDNLELTIELCNVIGEDTLTPEHFETLTPGHFGIEDPESDRALSVLGFEVRTMPPRGDSHFWRLVRLTGVKAGSGVRPPIQLAPGQAVVRTARLWLRGQPDPKASPLTYVHHPQIAIPPDVPLEVRAIYHLPVSFIEQGWAGQLASAWLPLR